MPSRFPADYDYDYDYDYDRSGRSAANVLPLGSEFGPKDEEEPWANLQAATFPRRYWDPALHALVVVAEFADTGWKEGANSIDPGPPDLTQSVVECELNKLAAYGLD